MKARFSFAVLILLISASLFSDTKKYSLTTSDRESETRHDFSREFFINNIYLDFMVPFGLDRIFTDSDYVQLFSELYNDLSANYGKKIVIPVRSGQALSINFRIVTSGGKMSLVVVSNYDLAGRRLVPDDGDFSGCYTKEYIIVDNSLVPGHIFYIKDRGEAIKKFRDSSDYNGLADYFLFDDDKTNDKEIPGIIAAGLNNTPRGYNSCLLKLTEAQYYIFKGKYGNAESSLNAAGKSAASITDPEQKKFIEVSVRLMQRVLYICRNVQQI